MTTKRARITELARTTQLTPQDIAKQAGATLSYTWKIASAARRVSAPLPPLPASDGPPPLYVSKKDSSETPCAHCQGGTKAPDAIQRKWDAERADLEAKQAQPSQPVITQELLSAIETHQCKDGDCGIKQWWMKHDAKLIQAAIDNGDLMPKPSVPASPSPQKLKLEIR